jgi:hypothetical protein
VHTGPAVDCAQEADVGSAARYQRQAGGAGEADKESGGGHHSYAASLRCASALTCHTFAGVKVEEQKKQESSDSSDDSDDDVSGSAHCLLAC